MTSRWDRLLDQKPVPLLDHLVDEAARLLGQELRRWPLAIEELDPATGSGLGPLLEAGSRRPSAPVFREALRLARWDLERDHAAYDDYVRNRYLERASRRRTDRLSSLAGCWNSPRARRRHRAVKRPALTRILDGVERGPVRGNA
jgi:hypothetical protein